MRSPQTNGITSIKPRNVTTRLDDVLGGEPNSSEQVQSVNNTIESPLVGENFNVLKEDNNMQDVNEVSDDVMNDLENLTKGDVLTDDGIPVANGTASVTPVQETTAFVDGSVKAPTKEKSESHALTDAEKEEIRKKAAESEAKLSALIRGNEAYVQPVAEFVAAHARVLGVVAVRDKSAGISTRSIPVMQDTVDEQGNPVKKPLKVDNKAVYEKVIKLGSRRASGVDKIVYEVPEQLAFVSTESDVRKVYESGMIPSLGTPEFEKAVAVVEKVSSVSDYIGLVGLLTTIPEIMESPKTALDVASEAASSVIHPFLASIMANDNNRNCNAFSTKVSTKKDKNTNQTTVKTTVGTVTKRAVLTDKNYVAINRAVTKPLSEVLSNYSDESCRATRQFLVDSINKKLTGDKRSTFKASHVEAWSRISAGADGTYPNLTIQALVEAGFSFWDANNKCDYANPGDTPIAMKEYYTVAKDQSIKIRPVAGLKLGEGIKFEEYNLGQIITDETKKYIIAMSKAKTSTKIKLSAASAKTKQIEQLDKIIAATKKQSAASFESLDQSKRKHVAAKI